MTIAERIADNFALSLDMAHLSRTQLLVLHAIKSVSMGKWAREELARMKGETK